MKILSKAIEKISLLLEVELSNNKIYQNFLKDPTNNIPGNKGVVDNNGTLTLDPFNSASTGAASYATATLLDSKKPNIIKFNQVADDLKDPAKLKEDEDILSAMMKQDIKYPQSFKDIITNPSTDFDYIRRNFINGKILERNSYAPNITLPRQELNTLKYNQMHLNELPTLDQYKLANPDNNFVDLAHNLETQVI